MPNQVITKNSAVAGKAPKPADIAVGELAVNLTDRKLFSKTPGNTIIELGPDPEVGKDLGSSLSGAVTVSRNDGNYMYGTMTADTTFTLDAAGADATSITMLLDTGGFAPTFTGVTWHNDITALTTAGVYMLGLFWVNNGWHGALVQ